MSETDINQLVTKAILAVITIAALYFSYQAMVDGYITQTEFLVIFTGILGAWGLGVGTYQIGKNAGEYKAYRMYSERLFGMQQQHNQQIIQTIELLKEKKHA